MKRDLLHEWHTKMAEVSWKEVMFEHPNMNISTLRFMHDVIRDFFPPESYIFSYKPDKKEVGWLHNYLLIADSRFVACAKEIAVLADYYNTVSNGGDPLYIRPKDYNLTGLKDRFFELFINLILTRNKFNNQLTFSYHTDTAEKPVDAYFEWQGVGYILECAKLYDVKQSALLKTVERIIEKIFKRNNKLVAMRHDIQPCGYILFKNQKNMQSVANRIEIAFRNKFQEYLAGMNAKGEFITAVARDETDDYRIFIGSTIVYNIASHKNLLNEYDSAIMFQCNLKNERIDKSTFTITAQTKRNLKEDYKLIIDKIKEKTKQHSNARNYKKIICIELEEGLSVHDKERPLYIYFADMNFSVFEKYVTEEVSLFFLFKRYRNLRAYYETKFLCHEVFDLALATRIRSLNFMV